MPEKDHFKNSSCICSKVKSKAFYLKIRFLSFYLKIRFLSFTAVTPAGTLGLWMSEQGGRKGASLAAGAPLASLPASPAPASPLGSVCGVAVAGSAASAHFMGFGGTALHPWTSKVAPSLLKTRWGLKWNKSPTLHAETISASTFQHVNYMRLELFPITSMYQV